MTANNRGNPGAIMDNPDDEKTTINVKGVYVKAWETAKKAANRQNMTMGLWLSRASETQANLEDGPMEIPAANPTPDWVKPAILTADEIGVMMSGMVAMAGATGVQPSKRTVRQVYGLIEDRVRLARSDAFVIVGKASRQSLAPTRQSTGPRRQPLILDPETRDVGESGMVLDSQERDMP